MAGGDSAGGVRPVWTERCRHVNLFVCFNFQGLHMEEIYLEVGRRKMKITGVD